MRISTAVSILLGLAAVVFELQGCGVKPSPSPGPGPSPSPGLDCSPGSIFACEQPFAEGDKCVCGKCSPGFAASEARTSCMYKCESDLNFGKVTVADKKGLCLDDTTLQYCPEQMLSYWANTEERVTSIRLFKAWSSWWNAEDRKLQAWYKLSNYTKENNVRVLIGTEITCDEESDDKDWENVKELVKILGADNVMGVAIGNELELLWQKKYSQLGLKSDTEKWACLNRIWVKNGDSDQSYFVEKFQSRVQDLDAMGSEFKSIKVTSVFGGFILADDGYRNPQHAFWDVGSTGSAPGTQTARVDTFFNWVVPKYEDRFVFMLNVYPYFDNSQHFDPGTTDCETALKLALCFDKKDPKDCLFTAQADVMRERMDDKFKDLGLDPKEGLLWIGETGWSSPQAHSLQAPPLGMAGCDKWSEKQTMMKYYNNFLKWDLTLGNGRRGPDHMFYFTMRDSTNFEAIEGFGLVGDGNPEKWCANNTCKLARHYDGGPSTTPYTGAPTTTSTTTTTTTTPYTGPPTTTTMIMGSCCFGGAQDCATAHNSLHPNCPHNPGNSWCEESKENCGGCGGLWCPPGETTTALPPVITTTPVSPVTLKTTTKAVAPTVAPTVAPPVAPTVAPTNATTTNVVPTLNTTTLVETIDVV